jgi:hypothetical protein
MALSDAVAVFSGLAGVCAITTGVQGVITAPFASLAETLRMTKEAAGDAGDVAGVARAKRDARRALAQGVAALGVALLVNAPVTTSWMYFVATTGVLHPWYYWAPPLSVIGAILGLCAWAISAAITLRRTA